MFKHLSINYLKTTIFFLTLMCLLSCKKEIISPLPVQTGQLIKQKSIVELLNKMPAATLLTPEWKNATQATIAGKSIVRIPIANVDRLKQLRLRGQDLGLNMQGKRMDLNGTTNNNNPNYFEKHPPELFIVEDASTHKLDAYMFNFVPTNPNVDFGENGVWTGTLYEWNLAGENIWVQEIVKNKLIDRYGLRKPIETSTGAIQSSGKTLSIGNRTSAGTGFFDWLGDVLGDVVGWIAHTVGIPSEFKYDNINGGWRIRWGSGSKTETPDPLSLQPPSSMEVSASYISGYFDGGGGYQPFPSTPDGSGEGSVVVPASTLYLIKSLGLANSINDRRKMNFLGEHPDVSDDLALYLQANAISAAASDFVMSALDYLVENPEYAELPNWMQNLSSFLKLGPSQLAQATTITNNAMRDIEAQLMVEAPLSDQEVAIISKLLIAYNGGDYYNNATQFSQTTTSGDSDDPFWNFIKGKLRKLMGIDRPESEQERLELETILRNAKITGTRIRNTRDMLNSGYSLLPGYSLLDAVVMNEGYSGAVTSAAFDVFGAGLFKLATQPLLRIGEKYTVKMFELSLKYPNIASTLRSFSISEVVIIKRSNADKVIIIGERMEERVLPSKALFEKMFKNIERYKPSDEANFDFLEKLEYVKRLYGRTRLTDDEMRLTKVYKENVEWMTKKMNEGYNVIDIGPLNPGTIKSPSYGMERSFIYR